MYDAASQPALSSVLYRRPPDIDAETLASHSPHDVLKPIIRPLTDHLSAADQGCTYRRGLAMSSTERRAGLMGPNDSPEWDMLNLGRPPIAPKQLLDAIFLLITIIHIMFNNRQHLLVETLANMKALAYPAIAGRLDHLRSGGETLLDTDSLAFLARMYALGAMGLVNLIRVKSEVTTASNVSYLRACDMLATTWITFANAALKLGDFKNRPTPDALGAVGLIVQYSWNNWAGENMDATQSLVALGTTLLKNIGLHHDPADSTNPTYRDGHCFDLRVIARQLLTIDWSLNSLQCCRRGLELPANFPIKHPAEEGDTSHLSLLTFKGMVATIGQQINIMFCDNDHPPPSEWTRRIESELQNVLDMVPTCYQIKFDVVTGTISTPPGLTEVEMYDVFGLYLIVCSHGIRLHRGLLAPIPGAVGLSDVDYHRRRLLYHCQFSFCIRREYNFPATFMPAQFIYLATCVASAVFVLTPAERMPIDPALLVEIHTGSRILEPIVKFNFTLNRSYSVLISLIHKISSKRLYFKPMPYPELTVTKSTPPPPTIPVKRERSEEGSNVVLCLEIPTKKPRQLEKTSDCTSPLDTAVTP